MGIGLAFWVIFLVAIIFFGALIGGVFYGPHWGEASNIVVMVLIFLLGWRVFGFMIRNS
jgi:hypothetical protein